MSDSLPRSLDEAFARMIHAGNVTELAERTGFARRDLYRWATPQDNPSGEHRAAPAKVIEPLAQATGRLDVLDYLAHRLGCVVVPIPTGGDATAFGVLQRVAALTKEFSDVQGATAEVLHDGRITSAEGALVLEQLADLQRASADLALAIEKGVRS